MMNLKKKVNSELTIRAPNGNGCAKLSLKSNGELPAVCSALLP
jgi:hypothetical protein